MSDIPTPDDILARIQARERSCELALFLDAHRDYREVVAKLVGCSRDGRQYPMGSRAAMAILNDLGITTRHRSFAERHRHGQCSDCATIEEMYVT